MNTKKKKEILKAMEDKQKAETIIDSCPHEIKEWYGAAKCKVCEKNLGTYCPKSPDKSCHYPDPSDKDKERVRLLNGILHNLTPKQVKERLMYDHMRDDWCIFCNEPDERK